MPRRFPSHLLLSLMLLAPAAGPLRAQENILRFYHRADSISEHPSRISDYEIRKSKRVGQNTVTFIGRKGSRRILIAAVTPKPLKNLRRELALTLQFEKGKPGLGPTTTWGYVFDRNGDGRVDYMALVAGAVAVEDDSLPFDFPGYATQMSARQFETYVSHCRIVFNHWADDNGDGAIDAGVQYDMDPFRNWVKRMLLIRSTKFDGKFDDVRTFRGKIGHAAGEVERTPQGGVTYYPMGEPRGVEFTKSVFEENTVILSIINRAAELCRLTAADF